MWFAMLFAVGVVVSVAVKFAFGCSAVGSIVCRAGCSGLQWAAVGCSGVCSVGGSAGCSLVCFWLQYDLQHCLQCGLQCTMPQGGKLRI